MKRKSRISRRQFLAAGTGPLAAWLGGCKADRDAAMRAEIQRAADIVAAAVPVAESDPARPLFHFRPPAQWMNDPNGPIFHGGYYHVFYQHNPFEDRWGHMYWGHTRSKDLVNWEHRQIALAPSYEAGESHCFSGCARVNGAGKPMFFYTSVEKRGPRGENTRPFEQWAAVGSEDLETWTKHQENPILSFKNHGGPRFGDSWRDPFLFDAEGRTFMVLGARQDGEAVIPLYESESDRLVDWRYRGILFRKPATEVEFFECPNFVPLGEQWMLIYAPYRSLEYVVGSFDSSAGSFTPVFDGILDPGTSHTAHFYASNVFFDGRGRCILLGWIRGFPDNKGWNGCMALPRILKAGPDGRPLQTPVPELRKLRDAYQGFAGTRVGSEPVLLTGNATTTAEWLMDITVTGDDAAGLRLVDEGDKEVLSVQYGGAVLSINGQDISYAPPDRAETIRLHVFTDRSTVEIFVDDGRLAVTKLFEHAPDPLRLEAFGRGSAVFQRLDVWKMKPVWRSAA